MAEAGIGWAEAVALLRRERSAAEGYVRVLKRHGSAAAVERGALSYAAAKAEFDAVIGGLEVALARKGAPGSLPDLEARLARGVALREVFCAEVAPLLPVAEAGRKEPFTLTVTGAAVVALIQAVKAVWFRHLDDDAAARATTRTQLRAALWPAFAAIEAKG